MSIYLRNIIRFILLILIQVLLLNKIPLRWWSHPEGFPAYTPFIYPLFLLLLPLSAPVSFLLLSGFVLGFTIDTFMNTGGIHAFACVFMAFVRTQVLTALMPKRLSEYANSAPNFKSMGRTPFLTYAAILLFIHHVVYYLLEIWSLSSLGYTFIKIGVTLVTSMLFVLLYALLFSNSINKAYYD